MQPSYDVLWRGYWGDMQRLGPVHRHIREDIVRRVGALDVKSVLDVGCGSGENLAALATLGRYDLSGVDISPEGIELARERVPGARMLSGLNVQERALPERFDLVMSIQVVEHIVDDMAALRNMVAKEQTYGFISTLAGRTPHSQVLTGHVRHHSAGQPARKLGRGGL